jgi:hypothetical protein
MHFRHSLFKSRLLLLATGLLLLVYLGSFSVGKLMRVKPAGKQSDATAPVKYCTTSLTDTVPFIGQVPPDVGGRYIPAAISQVDMNSFAWWEFIALNWCAAEKGFFGQPYDTLNPVQWETYITKEQLFPPGGTTPPSWNTLTKATQLVQLNGRSTPTNLKVLRADSKFSDEFLSRFDSTIIDSGSASEAAPENGPNWLGAQNSTNVWYEVRLNKDLYNYVVKNKFYNANNQMAYVKNGTRINLPYGVANTDTVGALELKAAWMEVNDISNPKWKRYKLTKGIVQDLNTGQYRSTLLALVGLHILHKTQSQQSWVWATFEQVDNVPNASNPCDTCSYNFNNPKCTACPVNKSPSYYLKPGGPGPAPIQISRQTPLDNNALSVNKTVQACIAQQFPGSVWQYYQLVNVIWAQTRPNNQTSDTVPLNSAVLNLPGSTVANTTLESYAQTTTCFACHSYATIAGSQTFASDFSFSLGAATSPALLKQKKARLVMLRKR